MVQGTSVAHLLELQAQAMSLNLPTYLVQDAGFTQVSKTRTAYARLLMIFHIVLAHDWVHCEDNRYHPLKKSSTCLWLGGIWFPHCPGCHG